MAEEEEEEEAAANIEYSKRLQSRLECVSELARFTQHCTQAVEGVLDALGWSAETHERPPDPIATCPFDANHRLPKSSLEKHVASCRLRKLEYSKEEEAEMYDPAFAYVNTPVSTFKMGVESFCQLCVIDYSGDTLYGDKDVQTRIIQEARNKAPLGKEERVFSQITGVSIFDRGMMNMKECSPHVQICTEFYLMSYSDYSSIPIEVPENHQRSICDLTPADRLAIYEHVIKETSQQKTDSKSFENDSDLYMDLAAKLGRDDEQKEPKSHLEILAEMRDYKRRRQSYRAKNVHITKKSYTEIIKDVINVHMEELSRQWKDQNESDNAEEEEEGQSSLSFKSSTSTRRRRSKDKISPSIESQSSGSGKTADREKWKSNHSRSPRERKRSPECNRERDSKKKQEKQHQSRDEDRHRSYKRRK